MSVVNATGETASAYDWVADHGDYLLRYANAKVRDRDAAEDLVQDTLLAAWKARAGFTGVASVRTWLTSILIRKIIDRFRRERRSPETESGDNRFAFDPFNRFGKWKSRPRAWADDPAANLNGQEFRAAFAACVAKLPPRLNEIFVLRYENDESGEAVATDLGLSTANVWVMLHRARMQMWQCLSKSWFGTDTKSGDQSC